MLKRELLLATDHIVQARKMLGTEFEHASYKERYGVETLCFSAGWTYWQSAEDQQLSVSSILEICQGLATLKKPKWHSFSLHTITWHWLVVTVTINAPCRVTDFKKTHCKAFKIERYCGRAARSKPFLN